ncbi:hypothetical protein WG899_13015 [Paucibacter sp. AS339]|uniref:hypothetical protein n=1 Tax=Paucibacter hankyongi TaxID=3133434 RepID=UPI0030A94063
MNDYGWLITCGVIAALTGGGTYWWLARKLSAAVARMGKLEAARATLKQQNGQARKQVDQLQTEVAELRHALSKIDAVRAQELRVQAASRALPDTGPFLGDTAPHQAPADGFAKTQVFLPRKD